MKKKTSSRAKVKQRATKRSAASGRLLGYDVAGKTSDGVTVLRAKARPTSFTSREIRETITTLRSGRRAKG